MHIADSMERRYAVMRGTPALAHVWYARSFSIWKITRHWNLKFRCYFLFFAMLCSPLFFLLISSWFFPGVLFANLPLSGYNTQVFLIFFVWCCPSMDVMCALVSFVCLPCPCLHLSVLPGFTLIMFVWINVGCIWIPLSFLWNSHCNRTFIWNILIWNM